MKTKLSYKTLIENLRDEPGVYRMLDREGNLLYIGKSIHIKARVASYFAPSINRGRKIQRMVRLIENVDVQYTDTELDALLLECHLIQEQRPPYNTVLTKSAKYPYLQIKGNYPYQIKVTRRPEKNALLTIGPLPHKRLATYAYRYIEKEATIKGGIFLENFEKEILKKGDVLQLKLKERMDQQIEEWAYEDAQKTLEAMKGMKYLIHIYEVTQCALEERYIGVLPIEKTGEYKYYGVANGYVQGTRVGIKENEAMHVNALKIMLEKEPKKERLTPQEIDHVLIVERFKNKRMSIIKV